MKRLLSLVAALAAATALSLMFAGTAAAQLSATTATATCTGTNADGTTATWTLGGAIVYTSDYVNDPYFPTFVNYRESNNGQGAPCSFTLLTSGDIKPNCAGLSGKMFIHYVVYPGYGGTQQLGTYATGVTLVPNHNYGQSGFGFSDLISVNSVQYKVTSLQAGSMTAWEVATSYL